MSIAINKKVKLDGGKCLFSTFLCLQGDHHCACAQKWCHFSFFQRAFKQKIKAPPPNITKIASKGPALKCTRLDEKCTTWALLGKLLSLAEKRRMSTAEDNQLQI